ncbi:isochorismate synthase [uncultured Parabacteroides sp.]|uniref:isochorismate synthase n=1 Tax=uncultured Parabacteroides sp. TaxID=512312 RepID=UPI0026057A5C|nr:isochorismate synthase [uncultured Parabacteroides sp.]
MTPDESKVCNAVDTFIKQDRSFALWRIPGESSRFAMQASGSARLLYNIEELDGQSGFVVAPFHVSKRHPIVLIRPDIQELPLDEEKDAPCPRDKSFMLMDQTFHAHVTNVSCKENPKEDYSRRFNSFIEPLRRKQFEKLVLSRSQTIPAGKADFSPAAAFLKATGRYKYSYVYLCHTPATGTWLGCTPEIILSGEKGEWHTVALAGTQPLQNGELPTEWDDKNREEQEYVAFYIRKQLQALGIRPTETPPAPVRAGELSHLKSDFCFPLPDNKKLGDLLKRLHPTPAVCGLPKEETYRFIRENEGYDRSYYSGFIGWLAPEGKSDLYVNLRCMNILADAFVLYAGGGILASSETESEWLETEAKMQTMKQLIHNF